MAPPSVVDDNIPLAKDRLGINDCIKKNSSLITEIIKTSRL